MSTRLVLQWPGGEEGCEGRVWKEAGEQGWGGVVGRGSGEGQGGGAERRGGSRGSHTQVDRWGHSLSWSGKQLFLSKKKKSSVYSSIKGSHHQIPQSQSESCKKHQQYIQKTKVLIDLKLSDFTLTQ